MTEKEKQIMVTCEYCGGMVNILNHEFCPGCGARFSEEQLEKNRRIIDKYNTEILNKKFDEPEYREAEPSVPKKKSRKWLLIIPAVILIAVLLIVFLPADKDDDTEENESTTCYEGVFFKVSEPYPKGFEEVQCNISGDTPLFDNGKVRVKITGLYKDTNNENNYILEYKIKNSSSSDARAGFACKRINGKTDNSITNIIIYESVSDEIEETMYSEPFEFEDKEINEIVFNNVVVSSTSIENGIYKSEIDDNGKEFCVKFN